MSFIRPLNRVGAGLCPAIPGRVILCVANLSRSAQATELDLSAWKGRIPLEMLGRTLFPAIGELPYMITLAPYGFYWLDAARSGLGRPDRRGAGCRAGDDARPCPALPGRGRAVRRRHPCRLGAGGDRRDRHRTHAAVPRRRCRPVPGDIEIRREAVPEGAGDPATRRRAIQQLHRRAGLRRVEALSAARGRHPSRNRDVPFPDRGRRLRRHAAAARHDRAHRPRRTGDGIGRADRLCRQPGRRLVLRPGSSETRVPGALGRRRRAGRRADPGVRSPCLYPGSDGPAGPSDRGNASGIVPDHRDRTRLRAGADHRRRSRAMAPGNARERQSDPRTIGGTAGDGTRPGGRRSARTGRPAARPYRSGAHHPDQGSQDPSPRRLSPGPGAGGAE
jgi:hypothetical protein